MSKNKAIAVASIKKIINKYDCRKTKIIRFFFWYVTSL